MDKDVHEHHLEHHITPLPGWACLGLGVGFIALIGFGLLAVRIFGGG